MFKYCKHCGEKMGLNDIYCPKCGKVNPEKKVIIDEASNKTSYVAYAGLVLSCFMLIINLFHHGWIIFSLASILISLYGLYQTYIYKCRGRNAAIIGVIIGFISFIYTFFLLYSNITIW